VTVLVTRGWPGAERTLRALRANGVEPIVSPVLDINFRATITADLANIQALVFTSANGVLAWGPRRPERDLPVYAVGDATAEAARKAGFDEVRSAKGASKQLAEKIAGEIDPADGALLHVRGIHITGDLKGQLKEAGLTLKEAIGYGAVTVDQLSEEALAALVSGAPVTVLIHSARGAKAFLDLCKRFGLTHWLPNVTVIGISARALEPLEAAGLAELRAAARPDEAAMMDALGLAGALAQPGDAP
jgi:uroporphyrinogen-III synthase